MNTSGNFYVAMANLKANKVRSIFSMLGIVIGTCSVILVVSMVNGTREATLNEMKAGKADLLIVRPRYSESSGRFGKITMEDVDKFKKIPNVRSALPELTAQKTARGSTGKALAQVRGIDEFFQDAVKPQLVSGRFLTGEECKGRPRVCLITDRFAQMSFGFDYPIEQTLRVEETSLQVVGVVKAEDRLNNMGQESDVLVPLQTLLRMMKEAPIYSMQLRSEPGKLDLLKTQVQNLISENQKQDLLEIEDPRDYLKEIEKWARGWMLQMVLIASISLLVGGVGLMNVMLTSVAERTHEIGLRKALGANSKMIQHQFLVEAMTLSGLGGFIGVLSGVLLSYSVNILSTGKVMISILPWSLFVSFLFSVVVGVVFGLFPASKAAHLSPVEALRYE